MKRLGIVGLGLIGGSIGLAARSSGMRVAGVDRDPAVVRRARERGAIDEAAPDVAALIAGCDAVGICIDVDATVAVLRALPVAADRPDLIFDVASVKVPVAAAGRTIANFVATHPIAGSERGGIDAADGELLRGASWAVVPSGDGALDARAFAFVRSLGAVPIAVGAAVHDAVLARTSHLPQVVAWALAAEIGEAVAADATVASLRGPGLRSAIRTARSPWPLWETILNANRANVAPAVRSLAERLAALADAIEAGDSASVASTSASGVDALDALDAGERNRPPSALRSSRYRTSDDQR